jgi:hypothetical protein
MTEAVKDVTGINFNDYTEAVEAAMATTEASIAAELATIVRPPQPQSSRLVGDGFKVVGQRNERHPFDASLSHEIQEIFATNVHRALNTFNICRRLVSNRLEDGKMLPKEEFVDRANSLKDEVNTCLHHQQSPFYFRIVQNNHGHSKMWYLNMDKSTLYVSATASLDKYGPKGAFVKVYVPSGSPTFNATDVLTGITSMLGSHRTSDVFKRATSQVATTSDAV